MRKTGIQVKNMMGATKRIPKSACVIVAYQYKTHSTHAHFWNRYLEIVRDLMLAGF